MLTNYYKYILYISVFILFFTVNSVIAQAEIKLVSKMTQEYEVESGEKYRGKIKLINSGEYMKRARIYKRDYTFNADGFSFYEEAGSEPRSNADWIDLQTNVVNVSPGNYGEVFYEISVPSQLNKSGTFWSVIIIEPVNFEEINSDFVSSQQMEKLNLGQRLRYAIQIVTNLGDSGEGKFKIKLKNVCLQKLEGKEKKYNFKFDIHNFGDSWLNPDIWMEVYHPDENKKKIYEGKKMRIFPGTSINQQITLENLKKGIYPAILLIDDENNDIFGYQYDIEIK
ncbi:MAG: hypothetical protein ACOC1O_04385 [bacterium]